MANQYVIIVAGGRGMRMGGDLPKQFLPLDGKPVLMHTIERLAGALPSAEFIVVLPFDQIDFWVKLCDDHLFTVPHQVIAGGESRFESVKQGLSKVGNEGVVGIHDGVRPFVLSEVIVALFAEAEKGRSVVPVIELNDSIRRSTDDCNFAVPRSEFRLVQTPQVFPAEVIQRAYQQAYSPYFTDDASVVEAMGCELFLMEGNRENIKITTPFDLLIGAALLKR